MPGPVRDAVAAFVAERLVDMGARMSTGVYVAPLPTLSAILSELWPDLRSGARTLACCQSTAAGGLETLVRQQIHVIEVARWAGLRLDRDLD